jgi:hypothetical protein
MKLRNIVGGLRRQARQSPLLDVMVEDEVTLHGCELLGTIQIGFRSYANNSLSRSVSIGRRCSIGAALHDTACFTTHTIATDAAFVRDPPTVIGNEQPSPKTPKSEHRCFPSPLPRSLPNSPASRLRRCSPTWSLSHQKLATNQQHRHPTWFRATDRWNRR